MKIDKTTLYKLVEGGYFVENYSVISRILTGADDEDGGGHYDLIIKDLLTGKLYETSYCDWDIENTDYDEEEDIIDGRYDLNNELYEVEAFTKIITSYRRIK